MTLLFLEGNDNKVGPPLKSQISIRLEKTIEDSDSNITTYSDTWSASESW